MERETKTITTPVGKQKVEVYTYLTGREKREITDIFLSQAKLSLSGDDVKADDFSGDVMNQANDKAIKLLIASVDGKKENILDAVLDMRDEDYQFIVEQLNEIQSPGKKK